MLQENFHLKTRMYILYGAFILSFEGNKRMQNNILSTMEIFKLRRRAGPMNPAFFVLFFSFVVSHKLGEYAKEKGK